MAQINFYVPDEVEENIKKAAKKSGTTVSSFIAELVKNHIGAQNAWPQDFFENIGGKWEGEFSEIEDEPPQERDWPE